MRIIHVIPTLVPGGAQNIVVGLVEASRRRGIDASVLCLMAQPAVQTNTDFISTLSTPFPDNFKNVLAFVRAQRSLSLFLIKHKPDILHSHLFLSKVALGLNLSARKLPTVDTVHDNMPWWGSSNLKHRAMTVFDRHYARSVAKFSVAISRSVQHDLQAITKLKDDRVPLVHNFISEQFFEDPYQEIQGNKKNILISCRLTIEKKGLDIAIEAIRRLLAVRSDFEVSIIGDGPDRRKLQRLIQLNGLESVITLHGYVENPIAFYRKAYVLLMPSRWEGFGLSAAEAGAMALPVVASDVGGLAEVVVDGKTGVLFPPADVMRCATILDELIRDTNYHRRLASHAREICRSKFRIERAINEYTEIWKACTD